MDGKYFQRIFKTSDTPKPINMYKGRNLRVSRCDLSHFLFEIKEMFGVNVYNL